MKAFLPLQLISVASMAATASAAFPTDREESNLKYAAANSNAEEARWLVNSGNWGVLSYTESKENQQSSDGKLASLRSDAISFADANGSIFFYLMGKQSSSAVTLTLSEASLEPTSNFEAAACGEDGTTDPEDPRCAKLSIQGSLSPCKDKLTCQIGMKALFDRHPEMKSWPEDHDFTVHELDVHDVWMISNYGGGGVIPVDDYKAASPKHHPKFFTMTTKDFGKRVALVKDEVPDWDKKVERARWIVAKSLWITVSTISVRLQGSAWGNIRSVVDGSSYKESTGKPVFYLPTPDPTAIDVSKNPTISLTFAEAALADRLDEKGRVCGGLDPSNPLCAQVMIVGKAVAVNNKASLEKAEAAFGKRHPLAPWLAKGGSHTGGAYYTIEPEYISILDYYGGATEISVKDYLAWKVPSKSQHERYLRGAMD